MISIIIICNGCIASAITYIETISILLRWTEQYKKYIYIKIALNKQGNLLSILCGHHLLNANHIHTRQRVFKEKKRIEKIKIIITKQRKNKLKQSKWEGLFHDYSISLLAKLFFFLSFWRPQQFLFFTASCCCLFFVFFHKLISMLGGGVGRMGKVYGICQKYALQSQICLQ